MFWVRFRKNSGHARGRGSGVVSFWTARLYRWTMSLGAIRMQSLALVGDSKEHLFHSYHKMDVGSEPQTSEVTCWRSHSLKMSSSGEVYSPGLFR